MCWLSARLAFEMQARRVDQHDLRVGPVHDAENAMPGRLRLRP